MLRVDLMFPFFYALHICRVKYVVMWVPKLLLPGLGLMGVPAFSNEWIEIDPRNEIVKTLKSERGAGWVITGQLDIDGDGDLDMLVAHEYLMEGHDKGVDFADFLVYFAEGKKFLFARRVGLIRAYLSNVEFRSVKGTSGNNALIKYDTVAGKYDRIFAAWYEKDSSGELSPRANFFPASAVGDADADDIVSSEPRNAWAMRGLPLDKVMKSYRRMDLEEARRFYGVTAAGVARVPLSETKGD